MLGHEDDHLDSGVFVYGHPLGGVELIGGKDGRILFAVALLDAGKCAHAEMGEGDELQIHPGQLSPPLVSRSRRVSGPGRASRQGTPAKTPRVRRNGASTRTRFDPGRRAVGAPPGRLWKRRPGTAVGFTDCMEHSLTRALARYQKSTLKASCITRGPRDEVTCPKRVLSDSRCYRTSQPY